MLRSDRLSMAARALLDGTSRGGPRVVACLLGLAVAIVYGQVLGFEFVEWDDPTYVTENPSVQAGLTWRGLVWALRDRRVQPGDRPRSHGGNRCREP